MRKLHVGTFLRKFNRRDDARFKREMNSFDNHVFMVIKKDENENLNILVDSAENEWNRSYVEKWLLYPGSTLHLTNNNLDLSKCASSTIPLQ